MSSFPHKAGSQGRFSQKVFFFFPLRTFSNVGKKATLAVTRWSKHWATLHWSALGFQLSCCAVKSPKHAIVSPEIALAAETNADKCSSWLFVISSFLRVKAPNLRGDALIRWNRADSLLK